MASQGDPGDLGVVVIGRNEGDRLRRSLEAASHAVHALPHDTTRAAPALVYVDSGSSDASVAVARSLGVEVVELDASRPFTAARGRNAGLAHLTKRRPGLRWVQFVDGDCALAPGWLEAGIDTLLSHPDTAVCCGLLEERDPEASVFNRLCAIEWRGPEGEIAACGGNALHRVDAISGLGGFREDLIAGEEPELCLRLRREGWRIRRIAAPMADHDAEMLRLSQWWRRAMRGGHTYAEAAWLYGLAPEHFRLREVARNAFWGLGLPLLALGLAGPTKGASLAALLAYVLLYARIRAGKIAEGFSRADASLYARYTVLAKLPEAMGQCQFWLGRARGRRSRLIEYK